DIELLSVDIDLNRRYSILGRVRDRAFRRAEARRSTAEPESTLRVIEGDEQSAEEMEADDAVDVDQLRALHDIDDAKMRRVDVHVQAWRKLLRQLRADLEHAAESGVDREAKRSLAIYLRLDDRNVTGECHRQID